MIATLPVGFVGFAGVEAQNKSFRQQAGRALSLAREVGPRFQIIASAIARSLNLESDIALPYDHAGIQTTTMDAFQQALEYFREEGFAERARTEHHGRVIVVLHNSETHEVLELAAPKPETDYSNKNERGEQIFVEHVAAALTDESLFAPLFEAAQQVGVKTFIVRESRGFKPKGMEIACLMADPSLSMLVQNFDFIEVRNDRLVPEA
jgi:hypothetical protein